MPYIVDTLTQNTGETDPDFNTRVLTYINDQIYYFEQVSGSLPVTSTPGSPSYLGYPPITPSADTLFWDVTAGQMKRVVTFSYDNLYYYKFLGVTPPLPPPSPLPGTGNVAIFSSGGQLVDGVLNVDTAIPQFTNLVPATQNGEAVEYSQFAAVVAGQPLTRVDDTNVTVTLGGTPATALLQPVTLTLGWSGQLSIARGGTGQSTANDALNALLPTQATHSGKVLTTDGTNTSWQTNGSGTVTSVDLSMPASEFSVSGNPITGAGTFVVTWDNQLAGTVFAGPAGAVPPGTPSFRALAASDLPTAALTKADDTNVTLTLGGSPSTALINAASLTLGWTGQLAVSRGGTGVATFGGTNTLLYTTAADTIASITTANSSVLTTDAGGVPSWTTQGTAFNKNFGTTASTITEGNDTRLGRMITFQMTGTNNPADSTTYHVGLTGVFNTSATAKRFRVPATGTIDEVYLNTFVGVNGSGQDCTLYFNNITTATATSIGTFTLDHGTGTAGSYPYTPSIAVTAGDMATIRFDTPAFTTNPTGVVFGGWFRIRTP